MKKFVLVFVMVVLVAAICLSSVSAAKEIIHGDIDENGVINSNDAILLARYLTDWVIDVDPNICDCNCDGNVNAVDAVLLAQYIDGWNVKLGTSASGTLSVTDAVNYSKKISSEFDGLGLPDTHHTVVLPKLNYNTEAAANLNKKIMKNHGDAVEILKAGTEDRTIYKISYSFSVCEGIVGIMISDSRSVVQSYRDQDYFGYYYDTNIHRELNYFQYLEALGVDYAEMVRAINRAVGANGYSFSTDYLDYEVTAVIFGEESFIAELPSHTWGTWLEEIPVSITGHSDKKYDVRELLKKWYRQNSDAVDAPYEWYGELSSIEFYDMDVDGTDEICLVYGDYRFRCVFYRLENGIYDMGCDIGPGWGTGYTENMFLYTGDDGIVTAHFDGTDYNVEDVKYDSYELRFIDGEWRGVD